MAQLEALAAHISGVAVLLLKQRQAENCRSRVTWCRVGSSREPLHARHFLYCELSDQRF